jgi:Fe2+ or Zn2+ uptake regulation protein|tara:strand:+ start:5787 stop:5963 length:177 start_codon:yes stop_codon:yes gene_type:complete
LDKTRNANYEHDFPRWHHDFPICEACNETVEHTNDNNMCEECANEAGIAYEESRNDLD